MQSPELTGIIDKACGPLAELIDQSKMPARMRVHPSVFACIGSIRAREIEDGFPLMFLGMELVASEEVGIEGFEFVE